MGPARNFKHDPSAWTLGCVFLTEAKEHLGIHLDIDSHVLMTILDPFRTILGDVRMAIPIICDLNIVTLPQVRSLNQCVSRQDVLAAVKIGQISVVGKGEMSVVKT